MDIALACGFESVRSFNRVITSYSIHYTKLYETRSPFRKELRFCPVNREKRREKCVGHKAAARAASARPTGFRKFRWR